MYAEELVKKFTGWKIVDQCAYKKFLNLILMSGIKLVILPAGSTTTK